MTDAKRTRRAKPQAAKLISAALVIALVLVPIHFAHRSRQNSLGKTTNRIRHSRDDHVQLDAPSLDADDGADIEEDPEVEIDDGEGLEDEQNTDTGSDTRPSRGRASSPRHRSSGHGASASRRSKDGKPRRGGPSVSSRVSAGLSNMLGVGSAMMRITSSNDPKIAKRDAKDSEKRFLREKQSLARALGKMPDGFIVELSLLRGDSQSVWVDSGSWPRVGQSAIRTCSHRGVAEGNGRRGCLCPALFKGPECTASAAFERARTMAEWQGAYLGPLLASGNTLAKGQALKVAKNPAGSSRGDFLAREIARASPPLLQLLPNVDPLEGQLIRSCAVVGNGAILLHGAPRGREIDSHSAVFRINAGPTQGYERIVGKKTTFRVNSNEAHAFGWREDLAEIGIQLVRSNDDYKAFLALKRRLKGLRLTFMHTDFVTWMDDAFGFMPSAGFYTLMMSLLRCARVSVYGFQASGALFRDMFSSRYHYYEVSERASDSTRDEEEWLVLKSMADAGLFVFGDPCIRECHGKVNKALLETCAACVQKAQLVNL